MHKKQAIGLIGGYGWVQIPSKLDYMISFSNSIGRMNIYLTTWTITIQSKNDWIKTYRNVNSLEELEEILIMQK